MTLKRRLNCTNLLKQTTQKSVKTETHKKTWMNEEVRRDERRAPQSRNKKEEKCFNCGIQGHRSTDCPDKAKGVKCFRCHQFGHRSFRCNEKEEEPSTSGHVNVINLGYKNSVILKVGKLSLRALLDTGSDISSVREDIFEKYFDEVILSQNILDLSGLGGTRVKTLAHLIK
uniref:Uncharacterized protein LOC114336459 n=1 Tax=Diabrotica virgifera virgifera TaxID=50390 RepID=A0A6P7G191_DIAVI